MNSTSERHSPSFEKGEYITQIYWFGNSVPTMNYIFLVTLFFYFLAKGGYLIYDKKSIIEHFSVGKCSEIKIVCLTSGIIHIIVNIVAIATYPVINEQACLFIIGYGNYLVQLCDNCIFYFGYNAIYKNKLTKKFTCLCIIYTIVLLSLSWLPLYTILPYVQINRTAYVEVYVNNGSNLYMYANILYNLFFKIEFLRIVYYYHRNENNISPITYKIAGKCLIHCFTSIFAVVLLNSYHIKSVESSIVYIFILSTSMNVLFNFSITQKIENVLSTRSVSDHSHVAKVTNSLRLVMVSPSESELQHSAKFASSVKLIAFERLSRFAPLGENINVDNTIDQIA